MTDRDWREWAYLRKENWPEAIPWCGPKREYGPYPWHEPNHHDPHGLDDYPFSHPDAASCGDTYMGDVCPRCGVPLRGDETVVNHRGTEGMLWDVSPDENPVPCYHPECWRERQAEKHKQHNASLEDFVGAES